MRFYKNRFKEDWEEYGTGVGMTVFFKLAGWLGALIVLCLLVTFPIDLVFLILIGPPSLAGCVLLFAFNCFDLLITYTDIMEDKK